MPARRRPLRETSFPLTAASAERLWRAPSRRALGVLADVASLPDYSSEGHLWKDICARDVDTRLRPLVDDTLRQLRRTKRISQDIGWRVEPAIQGQTTISLSGSTRKRMLKALDELRFGLNDEFGPFAWNEQFDTDDPNSVTIRETLDEDDELWMSVRLPDLLTLSERAERGLRQMTMDALVDADYRIENAVHIAGEGLYANTGGKPFEELALPATPPSREPQLALLALLGEWQRQRDLWALDRLSVDGSPEHTVECPGWFYVPVEVLRTKLYPPTRSNSDWRRRTLSLLRSLTLVGPLLESQGKPPYRGTPLLVGVHDLKQPEQTPSAMTLSLIDAIETSAFHSVENAFYCRFSRSFQETFMPHYVDTRKQPFMVNWGSAALSAARSASAGRETTDALQSQQSRTAWYFDVPQDLVQFAVLQNWDAATFRLALTLLSELTRNSAKFAAAGRGTQTDKFRVFEGAGGRFHRAGGSYGYGYHLETWLVKAGYTTEKVGPTPTSLSNLARSIATLHADLTMEFWIDGEPESTDASLKLLSSWARARTAQRWRVQKVTFQLPASWRDDLVQYVESLNRKPVAKAKGHGWTAAKLIVLRKNLRLTQVELGTLVNQSGSMTSQMERGMRPIPGGVAEALDALAARSSSASFASRRAKAN